MALLRKDLKRINLNMPTKLLNDLDVHLKNFETDRGKWLREATTEKIIREKAMLEEISNEI